MTFSKTIAFGEVQTCANLVFIEHAACFNICLQTWLRYSRERPPEVFMKWRIEPSLSPGCRPDQSVTLIKFGFSVEDMSVSRCR